MQRNPDTADLVAGVLRCDRAMLARAITLIESTRERDREPARRLLADLEPCSGGSMRVGVSGVPGVGKSTFIESLGMHLIESGRRVAVLAIDPTSSVSGGSVLGDKTRMERLALSDAAFVRPSPSSGTLGGVGRRTFETIVVCESAGFDVVLIETVGVGQSEIDVAGIVDFFVVLLLAGAGDELQGIKRGILELADLWIVNKADGPQREVVQKARAEFERVLTLYRSTSAGGPSPKVLSCSSIEGTGIEEVWNELSERFSSLTANGRLAARRRRQRSDRVWAAVEDELYRSLRQHSGVRERWRTLREEVISGQTTIPLAAEELLKVFGVSGESGTSLTQQEPEEEGAAKEGGQHPDG